MRGVGFQAFLGNFQVMLLDVIDHRGLEALVLEVFNLLGSDGMTVLLLGLHVITGFEHIMNDGAKSAGIHKIAQRIVIAKSLGIIQIE